LAITENRILVEYFIKEFLDLFDTQTFKDAVIRESQREMVGINLTVQDGRVRKTPSKKA
jgi:hypothetical protein